MQITIIKYQKRMEMNKEVYLKKYFELEEKQNLFVQYAIMANLIY
jgi:hypothetical protein